MRLWGGLAVSFQEFLLSPVVEPTANPKRRAKIIAGGATPVITLG